MRIKVAFIAGLVTLACASTAMAEMSVKLGGGWDGKKVPAGQQCSLHGGKGSTPPDEGDQPSQGNSMGLRRIQRP